MTGFEINILHSYMKSLSTDFCHMKEYLCVRVSMLLVISTYLSIYSWCFTVAVRMAKAARYTYLTIGLFSSTSAPISAITDYEGRGKGTPFYFLVYSDIIQRKIRAANEPEGTSMLIYTVCAETALNRRELCTQKEISIKKY